MARFIKTAMTVIKILACAIMFKAFFASFADETQGCQAEVQTIEEKKKNRSLELLSLTKVIVSD